MLDFETAAHNALKDTFHGLTTKGCFFHYTQCIWRRAQATGLQLPYQDNNAVKTLVRRAAILPLIPLDAIEDVWFQALEDRDEADITDLTDPFTDYVTDQWIEGHRQLRSGEEVENVKSLRRRRRSTTDDDDDDDGRRTQHYDNSSLEPMAQMTRSRVVEHLDVNVKIARSFRVMDVNGDGFLTAQEVADGMKVVGLNPRTPENKQIIKDIEDSGGAIDYNTYEKLIIPHSPKLFWRQKEAELIKKAFDKLDVDGDGSIDCSEMKKVMCELGNMSEDTVEELFKQADEDRNGRIDFKEIQRSFRVLDVDKNGQISVAEVVNGVRVLGMNPTEQEAKELIKEISTSGNGYIEYHEYEKLMVQQLKQKEREQELFLDAFKKFDKDGNGFIDYNELKTVLTQNGTMSDEDVQDFFKEADINNDGKINYKGKVFAISIKQMALRSIEYHSALCI
ncbi:hypothetical protein FSP39_014878 [Pinctada imbricata]|uniref:EF-hand domain-containing protein n=1 Tax=Pinctada imbricata TaxID=66713 RepID=A0AA88Y2M8_PINIB|nr:hypothetical protein FSP39_014878 [Pinctada imbricata]